MKSAQTPRTQTLNFLQFSTGPEQPAQASVGAVANIRPKPRIAWHRRPLFSPGLDGDQLVETLDGPGSEEWTFRESSHSQSVCYMVYCNSTYPIQ